jgi:hypothetical protein
LKYVTSDEELQHHCRPFEVMTSYGFLAGKWQIAWYLAKELLWAASGEAYDQYFYCLGRQHNFMTKAKKES